MTKKKHNQRVVRTGYTVTIEAESWAAGEWNPADDNTAVVVRFAEGDSWWANFVTYSNMTTLVDKNRHTGEYLSGKYLPARNTVLVDEVSRARIEEVVAHMNAMGDIESYFRRQEQYETVEENPA